jgi:hypothetical protein
MEREHGELIIAHFPAKQAASHEIVKLIRKLYWIGVESEAKEL